MAQDTAQTNLGELGNTAVASNPEQQYRFTVFF
jgi:hypothetical protein